MRGDPGAGRRGALKVAPSEKLVAAINAAAVGVLHPSVTAKPLAESDRPWPVVCSGCGCGSCRGVRRANTRSLAIVRDVRQENLGDASLSQYVVPQRQAQWCFTTLLARVREGRAAAPLAALWAAWVTHNWSGRPISMIWLGGMRK